LKTPESKDFLLGTLGIIVLAVLLGSIDAIHWPNRFAGSTSTMIDAIFYSAVAFDLFMATLVISGIAPAEFISEP
jgi:hypothetical protein